MGALAGFIEHLNPVDPVGWIAVVALGGFLAIVLVVRSLTRR